MSVFSNGYSGDYASLDYILQTLEAKVVAIPGVTCNPNLSVSVSGADAYYYTRADASISTGTAGAQLSFNSKGVARHEIPLVSAITFSDVLPHVNFATVTPDVVADRVVFNSIASANKYNEKFLEKLEASTGSITGTDALTKDTVYGAIVDAVKEFKITNKAKGMAPQTIVVGPSVEALLRQCPQFLRSTGLGDEVVEYGVIGSIAGMKVVFALDMDETTSKIDFIIMHPEGMAAPMNVKSFNMVDATPAGWVGGTLIASEMVYGLEIADNDLICLRKHA